MQVKLRTVGIQWSRGISERFEDRVWGALGGIREEVQWVQGFLTDENGPKGGLDKKIRIAVYLQRGTLVVIEQLDTDFYIALDRAVERMREAVLRNVGRSRSKQRYYRFIGEKPEETLDETG